MTQASRNPFPHSDSNKRYYTYDYYLRHTLGAKCAKLGIETVFSVVDLLPAEDIAKCREIAEQSGAKLRVREYIEQ